ncbi:uncharacterized protein LOC122319684 [Drosophila yakuba]|uniref:uncharacterized protein LOC122319684 n=1 Tax=Drosophila yakuba TaxID=7245 RepID=UPI001C89D4B3|nr:uncharacterized protein LOC122319684 [Drosophila yakuba]
MLLVVFDASCKTSSQVVLNDILMVGPTIQEELYSSLHRFRLHSTYSYERSALLNVEELATVLVGIEGAINSRPLGALSQDPSDGEALTPGHLLTGGPVIAAPALRTPDQAGLSFLRRWRHVSSVRQTFWRRWSREYVLGLQVRGKWHEEKANVEEGQLVVVPEDNLLPQQWLLGRIVATHAGEDGKVRVVDLRRSDGAIFRRAIHKLAPLPIC